MALINGTPRFAPWQTPVPGTWTAWADRYDGTPLGPVPLLAMSFGQKLSDFGTATATISTVDGGLSPDDMRRLWSWRLWLAYEGTTIWCGMPSGIVDGGTAAMSLNFTEIHGYLTRRALDIAGGWNVVQLEQTEIARQIAAPVADVGVQLVVQAASQVLRDRAYEYLEGPYRSDLMTNLAQIGDPDHGIAQGPEFRMEYLGTQAVLRIAYPRVGDSTAGLFLSVPGDAIEPSLTWDGDKVRTRTFAVGDAPETDGGTTPAKPVAIVDRPQPLTPRLDQIDDWSSVTLVSTLQERANTNASIYALPVLEVKGSTLESDPPVDSYNMGDDVVVSVRDPAEVEGLRATGRLVERQIDCATGKVDWTITMTVPPTLSRPNMTARMNQVTAAQAALMRRRLTPI